MLHDHNLNERLLEESKATTKIMPEEIRQAPHHQHQSGILKDGQEFHINLLGNKIILYEFC